MEVWLRSCGRFHVGSFPKDLNQIHVCNHPCWLLVRLWNTTLMIAMLLWLPPCRGWVHASVVRMHVFDLVPKKCLKHFAHGGLTLEASGWVPYSTRIRNFFDKYPGCNEPVNQAGPLLVFKIEIHLYFFGGDWGSTYAYAGWCFCNSISIF